MGSRNGKNLEGRVGCYLKKQEDMGGCFEEMR
jgi:hypothetical protein